MAKSDASTPAVPPDLAQTLTIYGRKAVLEALQTPDLACGTLHLASSNRIAGTLKELCDIARARGINTRDHTRESLARISRNGKQDQGVALDVICPTFLKLDSLAECAQRSSFRILALDGITNPQNVGMIIRSVVAGGIDGLIYPRKGVAALGPLVIKASVGTVFKAPIIPCQQLPPCLSSLRSQGFRIAALDGASPHSLFDDRAETATVFVLGNETTGVSAAVGELIDQRLSIPMSGGVESLNVAVTASLIAYSNRLGGASC